MRCRRPELICCYWGSPGSKNITPIAANRGDRVFFIRDSCSADPEIWCVSRTPATLVQICAETVAPILIRNSNNYFRSFGWVDVYLHELDRKSYGVQQLLVIQSNQLVTKTRTHLDPRLPVHLVQVNFYPPETLRTVVVAPDAQQSLRRFRQESRGSTA